MATCPFTGASDAAPAPTAPTPFVARPPVGQSFKLRSEAVEFLDLLLHEEVLSAAAHAARKERSSTRDGTSVRSADRATCSSR